MEKYFFEDWYCSDSWGGNCKKIPTTSGVYAIIEFIPKPESWKVIYIGRAKNLLNRYKSNFLLTYLRVDKRPVWFYFLETDDYKNLEIQLIKEHKPHYNQQHA